METSTLNKTVIAAVLLVFLSSLALSYDYQYGSGSIDDTFTVPEYSSQGELLTELVAPFIAIAVILQFAFYKVLGFTLATEDNNPFSSGSSQRARARKQSMVLSLVVTAMLIPSPYWGMVRSALQGVTMLAVAGLIIAVLFTFYYMLGLDNTGDGNSD